MWGKINGYLTSKDMYAGDRWKGGYRVGMGVVVWCGMVWCHLPWKGVVHQGVFIFIFIFVYFPGWLVTSSRGSVMFTSIMHDISLFIPPSLPYFICM